MDRGAWQAMAHGVSKSQTRLPMQETKETWLRCLGQEDPLEEGTATAPVFLPGESHGQRSPAGCSPRGHRESDTTE